MTLQAVFRTAGVYTVAISIGQAADRANISRSRLYQLIDAGVFPEPIKQTGGKSFFTERQFDRILETVQAGSAETRDGRVIVFYATKKKRGLAVTD